MAKKKRYVYKSVCMGRSYSRSCKKSRKAIKFFCWSVLLFAIIFLLCFGGKKLLGVAYKSDKILIKNIEIFGARNVTKSEIKELLPFNVGDNLLKINLSEAEEGIKKLKPELKNVVMNRRWQKVRIRLYERIPEVFVMHDDNIVGIDFDDKSFPLRGLMSVMKIPKIIYKSASERKQLLKFIKEFKSVCGEFLDNISEIKFSNTGDIVFITNGNTVVFWGKEMQERLAHKFGKFKKIYVDAMAKYKQIEYIDMTLYCSGRATVKPIVN